MGRKCSVDSCLSESNRSVDSGVTFHKVPMHADIRPKWLSLCRISDDKKSSKVIYVCSRHFLRVDFCNFKGKKYMLRQGVLPSVFPWDKSKLEAIKGAKEVDNSEIAKNDQIAEPCKPEVDAEIKSETVTVTKASDVTPVPSTSADASGDGAAAIPATTTESGDNVEKSKPPLNLGGSIDFATNSRIEALDFNNTWYPARIVEKDYEENEVLIHFEKYSSKYDEWINMDSPRLRPLISGVANQSSCAQFTIGEKVFATWSDARKFPAIITKILPNDTYEVLFDDGFVKTLKAHLMCKSQGPIQASPLFDPIQSTKQERREKKRKINIAALFGKRHKLEHLEETKEKTSKTSSPSTPQGGSSPERTIYDPWVPEWNNGKPVGVDSSIESTDGPRASVIVPDPRLPTGWVKHLSQRSHGASAGKWDTIIVSPDNRRFRTRNDVKMYLEENRAMKYNWTMFDFSIYRNRGRNKQEAVPTAQQLESEVPSSEIAEDEDESNRLKIPVIDGGYHCPIDGCGKVFRRETLAQMHVKYYHPECTKFLHSTPNVADLAYARTVGESLAKSSTTPKQSNSKTKSLNKDSEIIKLLNTKPFDSKKETIGDVKPLPSGLPSSMYPDIKLRDLLNKSEGIPTNRDDINLRALTATRPPAGIKTLLPVVRGDGVAKQSTGVKRKRGAVSSETSDGDLAAAVAPPRKGNLNDLIDTQTDTVQSTLKHEESSPPPQPPNNNIIIEGGEVIKIVRMKQEEIINCTCGFTEEDGLMIQCDLCLCWQHAFCNNIERECQVPENYICKICQNPLRQRVSNKYCHDQEWLKQGILSSTSFHSKDTEAMSKRFDKLKKSHDISGGLVELAEFLGSLKIKLKIAEAKNHPKLYLWSKAWTKREKVETKEKKDDVPGESMLMMILKSGKDDVSESRVPQPEKAIDSDDCRLNLLEHLAHAQSLVDERLDEFDRQLDSLFDDDLILDEVDPNYPRTRQTLNMLIDDLDTLHEFSQIPTLCLPATNNSRNVNT